MEEHTAILRLLKEACFGKQCKFVQHTVPCGGTSQAPKETGGHAEERECFFDGMECSNFCMLQAGTLCKM